MTDKPKWMKDAARAIWEDSERFGEFANQRDFVEKIATIILRHCPEDKKVGRLIKALKFNRDCEFRGKGLCPACRETTQAAIAL